MIYRMTALRFKMLATSGKKGMTKEQIIEYINATLRTDTITEIITYEED